MPIPKKTPRALIDHENATIASLRQRLEVLWVLVQQHNKGIDPKVISRRFKVSQADIKRLLAEHRRFEKYAYMAKRIDHRESAVLMKGDRTAWAKFVKQVKKEDKFSASPAGLKKTLAQDPRKATMRKALHLYYMIQGVVYARWKPFPDASKLVGKVKLA